MSTNIDINQQKSKKSEQYFNQIKNNSNSISEKTSKISEALLSSKTSQSVPFITLPGATKRKSSGIQMDLNDIVDDGPIPKQKRYEDKMSAKLDNIHIESKVKGINKKNNFMTFVEKNSRPKIVEIVDWDPEFLDEESSMPIIEEPKEEKVFKINEKDFKEYFDFEDVDDEDFEDENQQIILSDRLRQFISDGINGDFALLPRPKTKIIGNELVLFVQPSVSSLITNKSEPQIEEVNEEGENEQNNNVITINNKNNLVDYKYLGMDSSNLNSNFLSSILQEENYLKNSEEEMDIG